MVFLEKLKINITQKKWTLLTVLAIFGCYAFMGWPILKGIHYITGAAVLFIPIIIFSKLRLFSVILSILLSTIIALEVSYYIVFGERVSPAVLSAVQTVTGDMAYKVTEPILKVFAPLFLLFSMLFIFSGKEFAKVKCKKKMIYIFLCIVIPCLTLTFATYKVIKNSINPEVTKMYLMERPIDFIRDMIYMRYPLVLGDATYILADIYWLNKIRNMPPRLDLYKGILRSSNNKETISKIVIVIGESSVYDHYSIYGYPFETTPNLIKLQQQNKISIIDYVISPAAITRDSLRLTLSFATPADPDTFFQKKNIIEMAEDSGFQTIWLSATTEKGLMSSYLDLLSSSSQVMLDSNSLFISNKQKGRPEDLVLLDALKKYLKKNKKQFIILHLEGSHQDYKDRYDLKDKKLITTEKNTDYDRTIHHTDRLVSGVIEQISALDDKAILFYFSDHGEIINKSHGLQFALDKQYRIPFIFFQNKEDPYLLLQLIEKYRSKTGYFNLMNLKYILSELMFYEVTPVLVDQAKLDGETIFHVDQRVYPFIDIQSGKKPNR